MCCSWLPRWAAGNERHKNTYTGGVGTLISSTQYRLWQVLVIIVYVGVSTAEVSHCILSTYTPAVVLYYVSVIHHRNRLCSTVHLCRQVWYLTTLDTRLMQRIGFHDWATKLRSMTSTRWWHNLETAPRTLPWRRILGSKRPDFVAMSVDVRANFRWRPWSVRVISGCLDTSQTAPWSTSVFMATSISVCVAAALTHQKTYDEGQFQNSS